MINDFESMILAQKTMCLKRHIKDYASPWIIFLSNYLEKVGGKFILRCHFNFHNLPISMLWFYKDAWMQGPLSQERKRVLMKI